MQRSSQKIRTHRKLDNPRKKSPSTILTVSQLPFLKPVFTSNLANYMICFDTTATVINNILQNVQCIIDSIQEHKSYMAHIQYTERIIQILQESIKPFMDRQTQNKSELEKEPQTSILDISIRKERFIETNKQKQIDSVNVISPSNKQYRIKNSSSTKEMYRCRKSSTNNLQTTKSPEALVPLTLLQSEKDILFSKIQFLYRQKSTKLDKNKQRQSISKQLKAVSQFRSSHRQKQQFNYDYNGQKIPVMPLNSLKKNELNVLKTKYKIHKDRTEVKNCKKIQQKIPQAKLKDVSQTNRLFLQNSDTRLLKKYIERSFKWQNKLSAVKVLTDGNEFNNLAN